MQSNRFIRSYREIRLGLRDDTSLTDPEFLLHHFIEIHPTANNRDIRDVLDQMFSATPPVGLKDIDQALEISDAFSTSYVHQRDLQNGPAPKIAKRTVCNYLGDHYDPNDCNDEHVRRAESLLVSAMCSSGLNFDFQNENILDSVEVINSPTIERNFLDRKSNFPPNLQQERLLFYALYAKDLDGIAANNFDVQSDSLDYVGGIPFTRSPSLTIGSSGLLLCRVLLGNSETMSCDEIKNGKMMQLPHDKHSAVISDQPLAGNAKGANQTANIYFVAAPDQILPYCVIYLKKSLRSKIIMPYFQRRSATLANGASAGLVQATNLLPGASSANNGHYGLANLYANFGGQSYPNVGGANHQSAVAANGGSPANQKSHNKRQSHRAQHQTAASYGFPSTSQGFPPARGGFSSILGGFPSAMGGFSSAMGGFSSATGGYPSAPVQPPANQNAQLYKDYAETLTTLDSDVASDNCSICTFELGEDGMYDNDDGSQRKWTRLKDCSHTFHEKCFDQMNAGKSFFQCPQCKRVYGVKMGIQPVTGSMTSRISGQSLAGYPNCNTIEIVYEFRRGIQGPEHPNPGQPYHPAGFPRVAYLPDNDKGQKALRLLKLAFDRRLIFTVGRSATSGMDNVITWNDIHHKTDKYPGGIHGYPDPNYLDNLLTELAQNGVTE